VNQAALKTRRVKKANAPPPPVAGGLLLELRESALGLPDVSPRAGAAAAYSPTLQLLRQSTSGPGLRASMLAPQLSGVGESGEGDSPTLQELRLGKMSSKSEEASGKRASEQPLIDSPIIA
jgi:hypothetical protein